MGTDVPPDVGVVVDPGRGDELVRHLEEVRVVAEVARHLEARVAADDLGAGAGVAGVDPLLKRRVGAECLQHRQVEAKGVGEPDRRLGVGRADVDVEAAGRRPQQAAEVLPHDLVAGLVDQHGLVRRRGGMQAASEQNEAGLGDGSAQLPELLEDLVGIAADLRLQLDLFGEDLGRDPLG